MATKNILPAFVTPPLPPLPGLPLGRGYRLLRRDGAPWIVYRESEPIRTVDAADRVQRRLFVVELVNEYGFPKIAVHRATGVSRQTIDDWLDIVARWGKDGLLHSAHRRVGGAEVAVKQRAAQAPLGSKAHRLRAERREAGERRARQRPPLLAPLAAERAVLKTEGGLAALPPDPPEAPAADVVAPPAATGPIASAPLDAPAPGAGADALAAPPVPAPAADAQGADPVAVLRGAAGWPPVAAPQAPAGHRAASTEEQRGQGATAAGQPAPFSPAPPLTPLETGSERPAAAEPPRSARTPFAGPRPWTPTRYAGAFLYRAVLEAGWKVSDTLAHHLGEGALAVWVFIMMLVHRISSVEQLKTVFPEEFGLVLGLARLPSRPQLWDLLTSVYARAASGNLLRDFVRRQIRDGRVSLSLFYLDGHFLPYTGQEPVRYGYCTQRRGSFPGRTVYVTHEPQARIVTLDLQEGRGDLQEAIRKAVAEVRAVVPELVPRLVFDREGWSVRFFQELEAARPRIEFLTWEKQTPEGELEGIAAEAFGPEWKAAGNPYRVLEQAKTYQDVHKTVSMTLRRIVLWNLKTGHRVACVSNSPDPSAEQLGREMLGRWGLSENGMKRLSEHWNLDYSPGYRIEDPSADQLVPNPRIKELDKEIARVARRLVAAERKLARKAATEAEKTLPGSPPSRRRKGPGKLCADYQELQRQIGELRAQRAACPLRVPFIELRGVELKRIDAESKTLFDTAQLLVHNAQRFLVNELKAHYDDPRDPLVVLRMIAHSHGWVRIGDDLVEVRLEALPRRQYEIAQRGLLARLNAMNVEIAAGKRLRFELGPPPVADPASQAMSSLPAPQRAPV